jgi:hypothetical protein
VLYNQINPIKVSPTTWCNRKKKTLSEGYKLESILYHFQNGKNVKTKNGTGHDQGLKRHLFINKGSFSSFETILFYYFDHVNEVLSNFY